METPDEELERLIKEQQADDQPLQRPERGVQMHLSSRVLSGDTTVEEWIGTENIRTRWPSCSVHGSKEITIKDDGGSFCRACERARMERKRRLAGVPTYDPEIREADGTFKKTGPRCGHPEDRWRTYGKSGLVRCRDCMNARARDYYARNQEKLREKNRQYKKAARDKVNARRRRRYAEGRVSGGTPSPADAGASIASTG